MAEKPILFNTEMVKAILDGRKTQTRRIAFPNNDLRPFPRREYPNGWWYKGRAYTSFNDFLHDPQRPRCRYNPNDVLWVRETWQHLFDHRGWRYEYRADHRDDEPLRLGGMYIAWRPSIHMPRDAARLFLRVANVRAERLQDMKLPDIQAEGVVPSDVIGGQWQQWQRAYMKPVWNDTIKPADLPRFGWDANPWVWVIEFERCDRP